VLLGILFKGQNVAFMVGLAFAIACSANFPPLLLSIVWKRFTTAGAVASIVTGAVLSVLLIVLSPTVWVDLFKNAQAIFPLRNPAIVSMPAAVVGIVSHHGTRAHRRAIPTTRISGPIWGGGGVRAHPCRYLLRVL
jgi:cation/acetate symporter